MTYISERPRHPSGTGHLSVVCPGIGAAITVFDHALRPVGTGTGQWESELAGGVYVVETRLGDLHHSELVVVTPDRPKAVVVDQTFSAAAPVLRLTSSTNETHAQLAEELSTGVTQGVGEQSGLILVLRTLRDRQRVPLGTDALQLLDRRLQPVSAWESDWVSPVAAVAGRAARLPAGPYVLRATRHSPQGQVQTDQTIWLCTGWQTLVFVPHSPGGPDTRGSSVQMTRLDQPWRAYEQSALDVESALQGLRDGIGSVPANVVDVLESGVPVDPMLGIIAAQTLLLDDPLDARLLTTIVVSLHTEIAGHPDVTALAARLRMIDPATYAQLATLGAVPGLPQTSWPPMLASSYRRCLLPADAADDAVIPPASAVERVAPMVNVGGPWLQWTPTDTLRRPMVRGDAVSADALRAVASITTQLAGFHEMSEFDVIQRYGSTELARQAQLPTGLVESVLRVLRLR